MARVLAAMALLLLTACELPGLFKTQDTRPVRIDFAGMTIDLPKVYRKTSVDELIEALQAVNTNGERDSQIQRLDGMKSTDIPYEIYADTVNADNSIVFYRDEYEPLTEDLVEVLTPMLDERLKTSWVNENVSVKRVDNQYYYGRQTQLLKLKYELNYRDIKSFTTMYLISANLRTIGVLVSGTTSEDYEDFVTKVRFRK